MTSERDLARFTLEAVLLAHSDVSKCPDELEVYSDIRTLRDYAKAFDKVSGGEIKIENVPVETFMKEYNECKEFEKLLMILFAEGAYNYSKATGNDLLNPNESVWKLKKIEEYAKETGGVPWKDFA